MFYQVWATSGTREFGTRAIVLGTQVHEMVAKPVPRMTIAKVSFAWATVVVCLLFLVTKTLGNVPT
jgi:hypothetical protein